MKQFKEYARQLNESDISTSFAEFTESLDWDKIAQTLATKISQLVGVTVGFSGSDIKSFAPHIGQGYNILPVDFTSMMKPKMYKSVKLEVELFGYGEDIVYLGFGYRIVESGPVGSVSVVNIATFAIKKDNTVVMTQRFI